MARETNGGGRKPLGTNVRMGSPPAGPRSNDIEVRGLLYQLIKDVFPHIGEIVPPALKPYFAGEIDPRAWYEGEPYVETIKYLVKHISPQAVVSLGNQVADTLREGVRSAGITSTRELAEKVAALQREVIKGEGAGEWAVEEYKPGRAVVIESGPVGSVDFISGIIRGSIEGLGGYNVRVAVLDDRAQGADVNRYVVEWVEPGDRPS